MIASFYNAMVEDKIKEKPALLIIDMVKDNFDESRKLPTAMILKRFYYKTARQLSRKASMNKLSIATEKTRFIRCCR